MRKYLAVALLLCGLLVPTSALAAKRHPVTVKGADPVHDCVVHNSLTQTYSVAQLKHALATMQSAVRNYTSCQNIISDQLYHQLGKKTHGQQSSSSGGGSSWLLIAILAVVVAGGGLGAFLAYRRGKETEKSGEGEHFGSTGAGSRPPEGSDPGDASEGSDAGDGSEDPTELRRPD